MRACVQSPYVNTCTYHHTTGAIQGHVRANTRSVGELVEETLPAGGAADVRRSDEWFLKARGGYWGGGGVVVG